MKWILTLLIICPLASSQSNGFRPFLVQSDTFRLNTSTTTIRFNDDVTSGNVIIVAFFSGVNSLSVSDSVGTTYSMSSVFSLNDGSGTAYIQVGCGIAAGSGPDVISISGQVGNFMSTIAEFSGIGTCTTDGVATTFANTVGPPNGSLTTSTTTANSNDVCMSFASNWWATSNIWFNGNTNTIGGSGALIASAFDYRVVGAAGAQSITANINLLSTPPGNAWILRTQCYTPTFTITTDSLPHEKQGNAYVGQLLSVGGSGSTRTWSIISGSLPTGVILNSTTGALSGTVTGGVGTSNFRVQVSDGTHTAVRDLSIGIGASLATPAIVGHTALGQNITYAATKGNLLLVGVWGQENGGSDIWFPKFNGSNNVLTSSPALTFTRLYPIDGIPGNNVSNGSPFSIFEACVPSTASYNINYLVTAANSITPQFSAALDAVEVSGVQKTIDDGFTNRLAGFAASPETVTVNATAQVANSMAMLYASFANGANAPYTVIDNTVFTTVNLLVANDLIGSAGSFTGVATHTASPCTQCADDTISAQILALRPDIAGLSCGANPVATGTKHYLSTY